VTPSYVGRGRPGYPPLLGELHDPPARLYLRGASADTLSRPAVAVVGARSCSPYGAQVARDLGRALGQAGVTVVSGLARGVDGEAHRGALAGGGLTVAVLGCGIDRDYPRSHAELARRIVESGLVVSEYEPGVEPAPWRFPARKNRTAGEMRNPCKPACRPCRAGRQNPCWCGPGVVSSPANRAPLRRRR
jgi:DNA processing protein